MKNKNEKKGQLQALATILFTLSLTGIIIANNVTFNQTQEDLCGGIICENSAITCKDGFVSSCSNTCNPMDGRCSECIPDCTGHDIEENKNKNQEIENQINETITESNIPIEQMNEDQIISAIETSEQDQIFDSTVENESLDLETNESNQNETINEIILPKIPELNIQISYPDRITRGNNIEISTKITNFGNGIAKNIVVAWQLPSGFDIISKQDNCTNLEEGSYCTSSIIVNPSISTSLGKNQILVRVNYE